MFPKWLWVAGLVELTVAPAFEAFDGVQHLAATQQVAVASVLKHLLAVFPAIGPRHGHAEADAYSSARMSASQGVNVVVFMSFAAPAAGAARPTKPRQPP